MGKSRKQKWTKISTAEVDEAREDENLQRDAEAKDLADELFSVDTEGAAAVSKKRERRGQVSFAKKPLQPLTESEMVKVDRVHKRLKLSKQNPSQATSSTQPYDIWGVEDKPKRYGATVTKESQVRVAGKDQPVRRPDQLFGNIASLAPAVKQAHAGQSINPKRSQYEELVALQAAKELQTKESEERVERMWKPMTAALIERLGEEAVKGMTEAEKMKAFMGEAPVEEEVEAAPVKKAPEPKTTVQRNKEARVKAMQEVLKREQDEKKFLKSINNVGKELNAMKKKKKELQLKKQYKEAREAEIDKAEAQGELLYKARLGKYVFEEAPDVVVLPKENGETVESGLRQARVSKAMGSAIRERLQSYYRRKMLPAPPAATKERLEKIKVLKSKKNKSRKTINTLLREQHLLH